MYAEHYVLPLLTAMNILQITSSCCMQGVPPIGTVPG